MTKEETGVSVRDESGVTSGTAPASKASPSPSPRTIIT